MSREYMQLNWPRATMRKLLWPLAQLHRHRVVGLENLPTTGGYLLATNHSFATYDSFLLGLACYEHTGRQPTGLGDDLIFKIPLLRSFAHAVGLAAGNPQNGERLLREGHALFVSPGGMREALRPHSERYRVLWEERQGFVRLALRAQVPLVLAACPAADDIYTTYPNALTKLSYRHLKLPLMVARGLGPTPLPRPVPLTHYVAAPMVPPIHDPARERQQVDTWHRVVVERMQALMMGAVCRARGVVVHRDSSRGER